VLVHAHGGVRLAVERGTHEFERFAHQLEMRRAAGRVRGVGIAAHAQRAFDGGAFGDQIEFERDGVDQKGGARVVGAADDGGRGGIGHGV
jgi:hypothetical protein